MEWLSQATAFDILVFLIFLAFLVRGIWAGFIRQISSLLAMVGGFLLAGYFDNEFYRLILPYFADAHTAFLLTYVLLFVIFFYLIKLVGLGLRKVMDITLLTWFDMTVGGLFGAVKGVFVASLLLIVISSYLSGANKYLKQSITYPFLAQSSKVLLALIKDYDLRSYFIPREPAINLPAGEDGTTEKDAAGKTMMPETAAEAAGNEAAE